MGADSLSSLQDICRTLTHIMWSAAFPTYVGQLSAQGGLRTLSATELVGISDESYSEATKTPLRVRRETRAGLGWFVYRTTRADPRVQFPNTRSP